MMEVKQASEALMLSGSAALEAQTRGEIDMQITTAKRYPREVSRAKAQVLTLATCDKETAAACFYSLPREGKVIEGPSVRLAEIVAASYQNLRCGSRVVSIDATHLTAQGAAHDLENNVAASVEVKVRITKRDGSRYSDDMIVVASNSACSKALRNAVFKVVPSAIFRDEFRQIREVSDGDARTLNDTRAEIVRYFKATWKVDEKRLLSVVGRSGIEDFTMADVRTLRGLATALKDGDTTVEEAFPAAQSQEASPITPGVRSLKRPPVIPAQGEQPPEEPKRRPGRPLGSRNKPPITPEAPPAVAPEPEEPNPLTDFGETPQEPTHEETEDEKTAREFVEAMRAKQYPDDRIVGMAQALPEAARVIAYRILGVTE